MTTVPIAPEAPAPVPAMPDAKPAELKPMPKTFIRDLLRQARRAAKATRKFVDDNPSQQLELAGKKYPRVEAWQFLGACFGHTALITSTQEFADDQGVPGFLAIAHIRNADGQIVSGAEAACMRNEPDWSDKPSYAVRSMASTRAIAKAFRNIFAWVMVMAGFHPTPAEEMESGAGAESHPKRKTPDAQKHVTDRQISAFEEACATNGKTAEEIAAYLSSTHGVSSVRELSRGKQFTQALAWAQQFQLQEKKAARPIVIAVDRQKDAFSL